mmetsp:Transcript_36278/g.104367  ORF Transcript_36278/g.104367 Transcript_36278/m.104367 type:complete len:221 (+) Transcript_36278:579-1241(+)
MMSARPACTSSTTGCGGRPSRKAATSRCNHSLFGQADPPATAGFSFEATKTRPRRISPFPDRHSTSAPPSSSGAFQTYSKSGVSLRTSPKTIWKPSMWSRCSRKKPSAASGPFDARCSTRSPRDVAFSRATCVRQFVSAAKCPAPMCNARTVPPARASRPQIRPLPGSSSSSPHGRLRSSSRLCAKTKGSKGWQPRATKRMHIAAGRKLLLHTRPGGFSP